MRIMTAASAAILAMGLAGCDYLGLGGDESGDANAAASAAPDGDGTRVASIETPEGKAEVRTGGSASASLPGGLPAYPGASTQATIDISGGAEGAQGRIVSYQTSDTPQQVIAFYAAAAERAGYRIVQRADFGGNGALTAERGDGDGLHINALGTGDGTTIQIIAGNRSGG